MTGFRTRNTVPKPCTEENQENRMRMRKREEKKKKKRKLKYVGQEAILHTNRGP